MNTTQIQNQKDLLHTWLLMLKEHKPVLNFSELPHAPLDS